VRARRGSAGRAATAVEERACSGSGADGARPRRSRKLAQIRLQNLTQKVRSRESQSEGKRAADRLTATWVSFREHMGQFCERVGKIWWKRHVGARQQRLFPKDRVIVPIFSHLSSIPW
jgi:hypothetical protein